MTRRMHRNIPLLILLTLAALAQTSPVPVRAWDLTPAGLAPAFLPAGAVPVNFLVQADLDTDGASESLALTGGHLAILSKNETVWESPQGWDVFQASFSDLNRDGTPEVTLLVWRAFQPWPVDKFLPHGGRIATFHDEAGDSCHIILIGWTRGQYSELWAGSALAEPVTTFVAADVNGDGAEELVTLEGRYAGSRSGPARALKAWEWNGFGFTVVSTLKGSFSSLALARPEGGQILILTP
jgi:hypothetical protein